MEFWVLPALFIGLVVLGHMITEEIFEEVQFEIVLVVVLFTFLGLEEREVIARVALIGNETLQFLHATGLQVQNDPIVNVGADSLNSVHGLPRVFDVEFPGLLAVYSGVEGSCFLFTEVLAFGGLC